MPIIAPTNFATATVATPPSGTGGLSFTVAAGKGALFPNPGASEYFYGVFTNAARSAYEVVKVSARSTDSFTIDARGQDGTSAATWNTNDIFYLPTTGAMWEETSFSVPSLALAGVTPAADKVPYFTSASAAAVTTLSGFGRTLIDDADAAAGRATLDVPSNDEAVLVDLVDAKGDLVVATGANAVTRLAVGSDGAVLMADSGASAGVSWNAGGFTTGDVKLTYKTSADIGWVMADDGSIGNALSGATTRANADTEALYTLLWNNIIDTWCPVSGGRGATAAADFAAQKKLTIPKALGRALAVGGAGSSLTSRALGEKLGHEATQQHTHVVNDPGHLHSFQNPVFQVGNPVFGISFGGGVSDSTTTQTASAATGITLQNFGTGDSGNMQPTTFLNIMIKL